MDVVRVIDCLFEILSPLGIQAATFILFGHCYFIKVLWIHTSQSHLRFDKTVCLLICQLAGQGVIMSTLLGVDPFLTLTAKCNRCIYSAVEELPPMKRKCSSLSDT
jgi:hypothetical protein